MRPATCCGDRPGGSAVEAKANARPEEARMEKQVRAALHSRANHVESVVVGAPSETSLTCSRHDPPNAWYGIHLRSHHFTPTPRASYGHAQWSSGFVAAQRRQVRAHTPF